EFSPVPGASAAAASTAPAGPVVQGPLSIPVGDELPPFAPGSGGVEGNFYLAQAKGYTGAPRVQASAPVDEGLPPLAGGNQDIFGVFEGQDGRKLRGPQSRAASATSLPDDIEPLPIPSGYGSRPAGGTANLPATQQVALREIDRLRQEHAALMSMAGDSGFSDELTQAARESAYRLNALETEYAVKYGGEQADLFASSGGKTRPAPLRGVQEVADDWDPATDPAWGWMRDKEGNYVAGGQQSRPAGPMPEPPDWLDDDGLVTMHGGFGFFGAQPPKGRVSDYARASRKYPMVPDIAEYGFVSYVDALRAGRLDILEEQLALRSAEGYLGWGVGGESRSHLWPEYQYGQTFLQRMGPGSRELVSWTGNELTDVRSPYQVRPAMMSAATEAPRAAAEASADAPLKIGTLLGKGGVTTFETEADQLAFATWLDTVAQPVPMSFYGPPLGAVYNEAGDMLVLEDQRQALIALGYGDEDMAAMTATDAEWILDKGKRKSGTHARRTDGYTAWVTEERQGQMSVPAAADNLEEEPVTYDASPAPSTEGTVATPSPAAPAPPASSTDINQNMTGRRVSMYNADTGEYESGVVVRDLFSTTD
ncbi:MAG: hypothetical protein KDE45_09725, partial [Caldilineaceae bacterium]|nr:hypothetical protein [Caldilineaceae bacterium]